MLLVNCRFLFSLLFLHLEYASGQAVAPKDNVATPTFREIQRRTVTASPIETPTLTNGRQQFSIPSSSQNKTTEEAFELDLSYQKIDQNITIPGLSGLSFGCRNCTTKGRIEVLTGSFDVEVSGLRPGSDVLRNATVSLWLPDGFTAHVELWIEVLLGIEFSIPIIEVPISGFSIPGIAKAGLLFEPVVNVAFQASEAVEMTFGFEVDIPKNSTLELDFSGFEINRAIRGFNDTKVSALPASLNASISGSLTTSLQPNIVFGVELDPPGGSRDLQLGAQIAAVMDAPALTFNLSRELSLNGLRCAVFEDSLMAMVSTEVSFGMELEAEINLPGLGRDSSNNGNEKQQNTFMDIIPLPTTQIPVFERTVTSKSACVGEVRAGETQGPVLITSVTPAPTPTSLALPTAAGATGSTAAGQRGLGAGRRLDADSWMVLPVLCVMFFMYL